MAPAMGTGGCSGGCDPALPHWPGSSLVLSPSESWDKHDILGSLSSESVAMAPTCPRACLSLRPPDPV